ncbi:MAG TPA: Hsp20/alpha crystallin family protein [Candidatus Paceibacterota bacterium]|nr:Hsp20/alpha crystallin family protein [Candidatus Paceibacterota bacterium]
MLSFYQKLATKLNEDPSAGKPDAPATKAASFKGTGERTDPPAKAPAPQHEGKEPAEEAVPEGAQTLEVDLFQSEARMVLFAQMSGVAKGTLDLTIDEETNTIIIQVQQSRPTLPPLPGGKEGDPPEKGLYTKQEIAWKNLYRKVYLPASFDSGETQAFLERGVLIVVLPSKRPGMGKKLSIVEIPDEKPASPIQK